jgi:hypothetical protein
MTPEEKNNQIEVYKKRLSDLPVPAQKMYGQLRNFISGGSRLTIEEALALAAYANYEGLDPFNGECWLLKNRDGSIAGPAIGIRGLLRKVEQKVTPGENWWPHYNKIQTPEEDPDIILMYECLIKDTETIRAYIRLRNELRDSGADEKMINEILSKPPEIRGVGTYRASEKNPHRDRLFTPEQRAKKRALADALRQWKGFGFNDQTTRIDLDNEPEDEVDQIGDDFSEDMIDAEFKQEAPAPQLAQPTQQTSEGYTADKVRKHVRNLVAAKASDPEQIKVVQGKKGIIIGALNNMLDPGNNPEIASLRRHVVTQYLFEKSSTKDLTDPEWLALEEWMLPQKTADGRYIGNQAAQNGLNKIIAEMNEQEGQQVLFAAESGG